MGTNTLKDYSAAAVVQNVHNTQYRNSLTGDFVPRNPVSGAPEAGAGLLGTALYPWAGAHVNSLIINGTPFDPKAKINDKNQVISGATTASSIFPLYLQPTLTNGVKILGATTPLKLSIGGEAVTFSADSEITSLVLAPSTNNTCLVNNVDFSNQQFTKAVDVIPIDTVGSEIAALDGQLAAFAFTNELFIAEVAAGAGELRVRMRGCFFDKNNAPLPAETIADNDVITLLKLVWVFGDNTGTSGAVTYTTPLYSSAAPSTPAVNDYWFDIFAESWKRYDGTNWVVVGRMLLGMAVVDDTECVGTRPVHFAKQYNEYNGVTLERISNSVIESTLKYDNAVHVYGVNVYNAGKFSWDMATDLESGVVELSSTNYFFYITESGGTVISDKYPIHEATLRGAYHPFESWRYVGSAFNGSGAHFGAAAVNGDYVGAVKVYDDIGVNNIIIPANIKSFKVTLVGGGKSSDYRSGAYLEKTYTRAKTYYKAVVGDINQQSTFNGELTARSGTTASGGDINIDGSKPFVVGVSEYLGGATPIGGRGSGYGSGESDDNNSGTSLARQGVCIIQYTA